MGYTITYPEVKLKDGVFAYCPCCGKGRAVTITKSYYRNGLHDESETRARKRAEIASEIERISEFGRKCKKCTDSNAPLLSNWFAPAVPPKKPHKPKAHEGLLYLAFKKGVRYLIEPGFMRRYSMVCPEDGEPLLQVPFSGKQEGVEYLSFPEDDLYDIRDHYQKEVEQYNDAVRQYELEMSERKARHIARTQQAKETEGK